jgi:hypothetical protein
MNLFNFFRSKPITPEKAEVKNLVVEFVVVGPDGSEVLQMEVGKDIPKDQYEKFSDPITGQLYGLAFYKAGKKSTSVVSKKIWDQAKTQFDAIDKQSSVSQSKITDLMNNFPKD